MGGSTLCPPRGPRVPVLLLHYPAPPPQNEQWPLGSSADWCGPRLIAACTLLRVQSRPVLVGHPKFPSLLIVMPPRVAGGVFEMPFPFWPKFFPLVKFFPIVVLLRHCA